MLLLALAAAAALQLPDTLPTYDSPRTEALVRRAIDTQREPPPDLHDSRARVQSSMYLTIAPDSAAGGDLPASVDEVVSTVRWARTGQLEQTVLGHRTRVLVPLPYTLATILEQPWVIPHLYGSDLYPPFAGPRAVSPFGTRGPEYYRYESRDTVRIRVQEETVTLVPVEVRPREAVTDSTPRLVVGTFYLDVARAAVARARFGFVGRAGGELAPSLTTISTYLELENALWDGRYWLPYQQRREVDFESRLLGATVAARVVNRFVDYDFNTGWSPEGPRLRLVWDREPGAFSDWRAEVGEEAGHYSTGDFADLRLATAAAATPLRTTPRVQTYYARGSDLFRYDRVEGLYLGLGARLIPPDPRRERWQLYGTAGWAFSEGTPRGELSVAWGSPVAPRPPGVPDRGAQLALYRRLRDIQPFRPTYDTEWLYSLPALLWGSDTRDYYDATGVEASFVERRGRWDARFGGRVEREDSVRVNTGRFLFGEAPDFGPLASVEPGTHAALVGSAGYSLGPGAFGIGNSLDARLQGEAGLADFRFRRVTALLSARRTAGPLSAAARVDAGRAWGDVPPQQLFRFGSVQGLRGYEPNEFGGSAALLARGRVAVGVPPRSSRPLGRVGIFLIPPLRPAVVLLAESGWTSIDDDLRPVLDRLGSRPTDGARASLGTGVSIFDDALTLEYLHPVGQDAGERKGRWYAGLTYWY
jgi:hypothetical protein